jgi:hypothetical protein
VDNGFTGTNFDRPEFERMMQDVRTGKIQCIVVKDLSRFGRDYIETGNYLETIFPMLHIRFIAINDDFDNIRQSDVDSLAVPIKNMVNSLYAKDISKKIGLSYQMRREKGIPTSWCVPYGYRMNEQKSQYYQAQKAIRNVAPIQYKTEDDFALKGKICCGNCLRQLRHEKQYGEMVFCCGHKRSVGKFSHCYSGYYREQAVNSRVARAIKTVFTALEVVNQGMQEKKSITLQCVDVDDLKKQAEMIRAEQIKLYESYDYFLLGTL